MHKVVSEHFHRLREHAERHRGHAVKQFHETHKHAKKLLRKHRVSLERVRHHSVRGATAAGLAAGLVAGPVIGTVTREAFAAEPSPPLAHQLIVEKEAAPAEMAGPAASLASIADIIPEKVKSIAPAYTPNMTREQEAQFELLIKQAYGVDVKAEIDGKRLNATQGIIAGEQHLPLYPGDVVSNHTSDPTWNLTGMVPGLPSWGYFANSRAEVTQHDIDTERWYMAAQTYLSPNWAGHVEEMYKWFKYRDMVILNPETGQLVHTRIGDAGPGAAGRTYGGSNEVMDALGLGVKRTGHVYVFFLDTSKGDVPMGPISHK